MNLILIHARHTLDEYEAHYAATAADALRAFDEFDWAGETEKVKTFRRSMPALSVETGVDGSVIRMFSVEKKRGGLAFVSECNFPGETRRWFGLSKKPGLEYLHTQRFSLPQARKALALFLEASYPALRELFKNT